MPWFDRFDRLAAQHFPDMEVFADELMSRHTTIRIGGPARRLVRPVSTEQLADLLTLAESEHWPFQIIGNGSNLLVSDSGLDFLVIHTGHLSAVEQTGERTLHAESGLSLAKLSAFAQKQSLSGLEFAHGIPGTLGGAVYMNAGAYGGEMCQVVTAVKAWFPDRGIGRLTRESLAFGYRRSVFSTTPGVILSVEFALQPGNALEIQAKTEDLDRRRREKQPLDRPSAGSAFKRPAGHFAGGLIEQCGLKGYRIGGAQVSEKHAGFIINAGGASCEDIRRLILHIQTTVLEQTGISLEPEIKMIP